MKEFGRMSADERRAVKAELEARIAGFRGAKLDLDMTRGKPGADQLDIANGLLTAVDGKSWKTPGGVDSRNYGGLDGIDEAKKLFGDYLGLAPAQVVVGGNSSLAMMHDAICQLVTHGAGGSAKPWFGTSPAFICPVPGYDRHFTILERYGIRAVTVPMLETGPDMDAVEKLAATDASIRGMWCVPRFSNPTGYTCDERTVARLGAMKTAASDFRIFWDDAYAVHHLGKPVALASIVDACRKGGNPDRALVFGSTSKISFPGGGVAFMGASEAACAWARERLFVQTIGPDKVNILRHVLYFRDMAGIMAHMDKHAKILAPKFAAVDRILTAELGGSGIASWTKPLGGYFISLDTADGLAARAVKLAAELGVKVTPAGSTFPGKKDPRDRNIRIAPTFPGPAALEKATEVLAVCVKQAALS